MTCRQFFSWQTSEFCKRDSFLEVGMALETKFFQFFLLHSPARFIFLLLQKDFMAKNNQNICPFAYKTCVYLKIKTSSTLLRHLQPSPGNVCLCMCECLCVCNSTVTLWLNQGLRTKSLSETHPRLLILVSDQKALFIICTTWQVTRTEPLGFFARCFLSFLMSVIKPAPQKSFCIN